KNVVNETNHFCEPGFTAIFRQIDTRHDAKRRTEYRRPQDQQSAACQGVRQSTTRRVRRRRHFGEQRQRHAVDTANHGREEDPDQPEQTKGHRRHRERQRDTVFKTKLRLHFAAGSRKLSSALQFATCQYRDPSFFARRRIISLEIASTMKVITNRIKPSSISAATCSPDSASANSFASAEVILLPGI